MRNSKRNCSVRNIYSKNKIRKAKQAKSREKVLEKMQRIEKVNHVPRSRFDFNVYEEPVSRILQAEKLRIGYSSPLCPELNLQVKKEKR